MALMGLRGRPENQRIRHTQRGPTVYRLLTACLYRYRELLAEPWALGLLYVVVAL